MLNLIPLILLASLTGAAAGLSVAYWFLTHHHAPDTAYVEPPDPFVSAEIDQAAARWAAKEGRPEAAGVMADKLHMLYGLARRRRRS
jgi:hypothetical protein